MVTNIVMVDTCDLDWVPTTVREKEKVIRENEKVFYKSSLKHVPWNLI